MGFHKSAVFEVSNGRQVSGRVSGYHCPAKALFDNISLLVLRFPPAFRLFGPVRVSAAPGGAWLQQEIGQ
jgi:hypothetical protein